MRDGWSIKDAGAVLGIAPTKVPQAITPAFRKVARLMLADPYATQIELLSAMIAVRAELDEREIDKLVAMHGGRIERSEVHPKPTAVGP